MDLIQRHEALRKALTLEVLLNKCQTVKPRYYTIASSSNLHPSRVHIAISLTKENKSDGTEHVGWASDYLERVAQNMKVGPVHMTRLFVKDSSFVMPTSTETPIIMVGPGTGVVPFVGFMQDRELAQAAGKTLGEARLYFGCRQKDSDYIYRDEMASMSDKKIITSLNIGFSREKNEPKAYV